MYSRVKRRVFEIISKGDDGDRLSRLFDGTIVALIVLSVVSIVLQSFADLAARYAAAFAASEILCVLVFTAEYLLRIWTAEFLYPGSKCPRLRYIFSPMAIVDLLAILPFFLPFVSADLRFLRMMRLLRLSRLLRVFKLGRYVDALTIIGKVIRSSLSQLAVSIVICGFVTLFASIVMYTVEYPAQPEQFPNIIATLWWAVCTLTTVGYGDVYPVTPLGRFLAAIISLVGIGIVAIPTGIIAAGFTSAIEITEDGERDKKRYCPYCGHKLDD